MPCSKSSQSLTKIVIMIKMFPTAKEILAVQKFLKRFSKITIPAESKFELSQYLKDFPCQQLGALSTRTELKGYISEMQRKARNKNHSNSIFWQVFVSNVVNFRYGCLILKCLIRSCRGPICMTRVLRMCKEYLNISNLGNFTLPFRA